MNEYIFLTFAVFGIGGTQIYVRNKLRYLEQNGWNVKVVTTEKGSDLRVAELLPYKNMVFPELLNNPNLYSQREKKAILDRLCEALGKISTGSVIESNFIQVTFWGELLAKKLGIKHFIFLIQEDYHIHIKSYLRYFKYKFDRGEFAVNTKYALAQLFEGFTAVPPDKNGYLAAVCYNTVEDCFTDIPDQLPSADYIIGSIGRVNKPFVTHMVEDITVYALAHMDKHFLLLLIGGAPLPSDYDRIRAIVSRVPSLNVYITGPVYPVPKKLLKKVNVFVASAGAARTSADEGYLTIAIDANDYQPIGVVGYTTEDLVHRKPDSSSQSLGELLDKIIFQGEYGSERKPVCNIESEIDVEFDKHIAYLEHSQQKLLYYNILLIQPRIGIRLSWLRRILQGR